ncbi:MAG: phosphoenolpyruvate--protein phosphotransferase, partial [Duodenibacillus sp.]
MADNTQLPDGVADSKAHPPAQDPAAEAAAETSFRLTGTPVFDGCVLGHVRLLAEGELDIPHFTIEKSQTRAEFTRLRGAINTVIRELEDLLGNDDDPDNVVPAEARAFIDLHCEILKDPSLISETQDIIRDRLVNAEWALAMRLEDLHSSFEDIEDDYLAERIQDISQMIERVQRVLMGRRRPCDTVSKAMSDTAVILVSEDLSPADILSLKRRGDLSVAGLLLEYGSVNSHTSILARSLEIPMMVGVAGIRERVHEDDVIFLNASQSTALVNPSEEEMPALARVARTRAISSRRLRTLRSRSCTTLDGTSVELLGNIALPEDVTDVVKNRADGIGLFRSEFLFMNRPDMPGEDEQVEAYQSVLRAMKGKIVTIRIMDLGGDKTPTTQALESIGESPEAAVINPSMGRRGIRFCIEHPKLFKTQMRAILRASNAGNVRILIPMLSRISEVLHVRRLIDLCRQELEAEGHRVADNIPVGGMIEVPAVVFCLEHFLQVLDFVSIGTNDLMQFMVAADRLEPSVAGLCHPMHPAMLIMLDEVIGKAVKAGKDISLCGQAAADPFFAQYLVGVGLRSL